MSSPRNVLVTGGSSGLGAAVVEAVAQQGWRPLILDREPSPAGREGIVVDLSDRQATERAVAEASERLGGVDAVVTCAGTDACGRLDTVSAEAWEKVIQVNLLGTVAVIRAALPDLVARHGNVVTVASTLGFRALSDATAYSASKFGVVGFTRALMAELQGQIGITMLVPGGMETHFFDGRDEQYKPGPDAKLNKPENVAQAVVFALSQPEGCEVRELVITPSVEPSWP